MNTLTKSVQKCLKDNSIDYIDWSENAPAVPQARPIEKFWSICKNYYSKRIPEPNGLIGFRKIWKNISKSVAQTFAQTITKSLRRRLKLIGDQGVYASLKI